MNYKKPFAAWGSRNLLQHYPMAYANESDQEAANFLVASASDSRSQEHFSSNLGF
jgi:hypothetical protein